MTPAGIEPATFRFVAQHLNHAVSDAHNNIHVPTVNFQSIVNKYADHSPLDFYLFEHLKKLQFKMKRHFISAIFMHVKPSSIVPGTFESDNSP